MRVSQEQTAPVTPEKAFDRLQVRIPVNLISQSGAN
jgi:hypothetical protein